MYDVGNVALVHPAYKYDRKCSMRFLLLHHGGTSGHIITQDMRRTRNIITGYERVKLPPWLSPQECAKANGCGFIVRRKPVKFAIRNTSNGMYWTGLNWSSVADPKLFDSTATLARDITGQRNSEWVRQ